MSTTGLIPRQADAVAGNKAFMRVQHATVRSSTENLLDNRVWVEQTPNKLDRLNHMREPSENELKMFEMYLKIIDVCDFGGRLDKIALDYRSNKRMISYNKFEEYDR